MPGDYTPRDNTHYDCGHKTLDVVRSNAHQAYLDRLYMRSHGYPDYARPALCPACVTAAKASAR